MSKVVFKSPYAKTGKSVGGNYTSYIAKRDRVDKSIVFNLCKMIEHSTEHTIEEGFTKSIVDSREREKEFKRNQALGIHMGGM